MNDAKKRTDISLESTEHSAFADTNSRIYVWLRSLVREPEATRLADEPACAQMVAQLRELKSETPPPPRELGQYELLERVGRGGMGEVWKARHLKLDRMVAVKLMHPQIAAAPEAGHRFAQEIRAIGQLTHPNIVRALDAGEIDGCTYLAMDYVEGRSLSDPGATGSIDAAAASARTVCDIGRQAALALQCAHSHGIIHRDVKPSNLMIDSEGSVRLLDLGLARLMTEGDGTTELTALGQVMGTMDYIAPEQLRDSRRVDQRTDIYSLGGTLYRLLTGRAPFALDHCSTVESKALAIACDTPEPVHSLRPDVPSALSDLVMQMLHKDPEERPQSMQDVAESLELLRDASCQPMSVSEPVETPAALVTSSHHGSHPRRTLLAAGGLVAGLLLLAGLVIRLKDPVYGDLTIVAPERVQIRAERVDNPDDAFTFWSDDQTATLRSGTWKITIAGQHDGVFTVDNDVITIGDGTGATVTVSRDTVKGSADPAERPELPEFVPRTGPRSPFVLIGATGESKGFDSFAAAFNEQAAGDVIELRFNGDRLLGVALSTITEPLHFRCGEQFLPRLIVDQPLVIEGGALTVESAADGSRPCLELRTEVLLRDSACTLRGCDIMQRRNSCMIRGGGRRWEISGCRWLSQSIGPIYEDGPGISVNDCLFRTHYGIGLGADVEADISNCVFVEGSMISLVRHGIQGQQIRLSRNTVFNAQGAVIAASVRATDRPAIIDAVDNIFDCGRAMFSVESNSSGRHWREWPQSFRWQGRHNLFVGHWFPQQWDTSGWPQHGSSPDDLLEQWNQLWEAPEQESSAARSLPFRVNELDDAGLAKRRALLEPQIDQLSARWMPDRTTGPDWDLIGAGDPWTAVMSQQSDDGSQRLPATSSGPFVVLRNSQQQAGFPALGAAIEASQDGDVIEVRTDRHIDEPFHWTGAGDRSLIIRAARGYHPVFASKQSQPGPGRVSLEGLTFLHPMRCRLPDNDASDSEFGWTDSIVNCTFRQGLMVCGPGPAHGTLRIVNSFVGSDLALYGAENALQVEVSNSLLESIGVANKSTQLSLAKSAVVSVRPNRLGQFSCLHRLPRGATELELLVLAYDSVFSSPGLSQNLPMGWQGDHNLFLGLLPGANNPDVRDLSQWQQHFATDEHSRGGFSLTVVPGQFAVWNPSDEQTSVTGQGADIEQLTQALSGSPPR